MGLEGFYETFVFGSGELRTNGFGGFLGKFCLWFV